MGTTDGDGPTRRRWHRLDTDQRRAEILAVANQLFSERPYGSVSTTEIAEAAGVTRGLVHHYFGTKRDLYLEAVQAMVAPTVVGLLDAVGASSSRDATWEASVEAWMAMIEANQEAWLGAISAGETGRDPKMQSILDRVRERLASRVIAVLALDEAASPEVRSLVRAFAGFAEQTTVEWLDRGRLTREQAKVMLTGTLPLLAERLLPDIVARRG